LRPGFLVPAGATFEVAHTHPWAVWDFLPHPGPSIRVFGAPLLVGVIDWGAVAHRKQCVKR